MNVNMSKIIKEKFERVRTCINTGILMIYIMTCEMLYYVDDEDNKRHKM